MALKPLYCWKTDKDGRPMVDGRGDKIPHPKQGMAKPRKDWTDEECLSHDAQMEHFDSLRRLHARNTVEPIEQARQVIDER